MESLEIKYHTNYGAPELKQVYKQYMMRGLIIAAAFHFLGMGVYWGSIYLSQEDEPSRVVRIMKYSELGPPPSLQNAAPAVAVTGSAVRPSVGIPVPVPDAEVNPEQTIATQEELSREAVLAPTGGDVPVLVDKDIKIEDEEPPADYVPYEKAPEPIKQVTPKYPDLATRAGLEGTVWVKIWVDKEGRARRAIVMKSDAEIFNQPATEAAMQWVFTPAMMKNGPVSVWVSIPFRFKLQGK